MRAPVEGDGEEIYKAVVETQAELEEYMPWAQGTPTVEQFNTFVRESIAKWKLRQDLAFTVWDRKTDEYVGNTGLHRIKWNVPCFEVGYWIRKSRMGQGLVTESANALTRYAFTQLKAKRVELRCDTKNIKSLAVFKRLGFDYEGCLRRDDLSADGTTTRDTFIYSRISPDGLPFLDVKW